MIYLGCVAVKNMEHASTANGGQAVLGALQVFVVSKRRFERGFAEASSPSLR